MMMTIEVDDDLWERARFYAGPVVPAELVRLAFTSLIEGEAARRLALMGGTEPRFDDIQRWRPEPEAHYSRAGRSSRPMTTIKRTNDGQKWTSNDANVAASPEENMMDTSITLNNDLLAEAQGYMGAMGMDELLNEALRALIQRENADRLINMGGTEPQLEYIPRRRPEPA